MELTLDKLMDLYPELTSAAKECFCITDAVLHKLLMQKHDKKDRGLRNMLEECRKHIDSNKNISSSVSNSMAAMQEEEELAKIKLEKEARENGIELDRRKTLENMKEDYEALIKQEDALNEEDED